MDTYFPPRDSYQGNKLLLKVGYLPCSRWPRENEPKGIFWSSLSHNTQSWHLFLTLGPSHIFYGFQFCVFLKWGSCVSLHLHMFLVIFFPLWFFFPLLWFYLTLFYYYPLDARSFSNHRQKRSGVEGLGGVRAGETIIRIYGTKKFHFH